MNIAEREYYKQFFDSIKEKKIKISETESDRELLTTTNTKLYEYLNYLQLPNSEMNNFQQIKENIDFLNARMNFIKKDITNFDIFNIQEAIKSESDLYLLNYLSPNSAAILDTDIKIRYQDQFLVRGDIIFKDDKNNFLIIKASSAGYYVPTISSSSSENSTKLKIRYDFKTEKINDVEEEIEIEKSDKEYFYKPGKISIINKIVQKKDDEGSFIKPIIDFYLGEEKICFDYEIITETETGEETETEEETETSENDVWYIEPIDPTIKSLGIEILGIEMEIK